MPSALLGPVERGLTRGYLEPRTRISMAHTELVHLFPESNASPRYFQ